MHVQDSSITHLVDEIQRRLEYGPQAFKKEEVMYAHPNERVLHKPASRPALNHAAAAPGSVLLLVVMNVAHASFAAANHPIAHAEGQFTLITLASLAVIVSALLWSVSFVFKGRTR